MIRSFCLILVKFARRQRIFHRHLAGPTTLWRKRTLARATAASLSFFFVQHVMEEPFDRYAIFVLVYYLSSSLAIPIWLRISYRLGKHKTVVLGLAIRVWWSHSSRMNSMCAG